MHLQRNMKDFSCFFNKTKGDDDIRAATGSFDKCNLLSNSLSSKLSTLPKLLDNDNLSLTQR